MLRHKAGRWAAQFKLELWLRMLSFWLEMPIFDISPEANKTASILSVTWRKLGHYGLFGTPESCDTSETRLPVCTVSETHNSFLCCHQLVQRRHSYLSPVWNKLCWWSEEKYTQQRAASDSYPNYVPGGLRSIDKTDSSASQRKFEIALRDLDKSAS